MNTYTVTRTYTTTTTTTITVTETITYNPLAGLQMFDGYDANVDLAMQLDRIWENSIDGYDHAVTLHNRSRKANLRKAKAVYPRCEPVATSKTPKTRRSILAFLFNL